MKLLKRLFKRIPLCPYPYKPYMHKYKCIFIHIPKNAGSSIMHLLGDTGGRFHVESEFYREVNDYFYRKYHTFAFTREPLDRLFSAYKYARAGGNKGSEDLQLAQYVTQRCDDFSGFIDNVLNEHFIMQQPVFKPQYLYVFSRNLTLNIDTLIKMEELESQWPVFAKKRGLPVELAHENKSKELMLPELTPQQYEKIYTLYQYDYSLLGYKK